MDFKFKSKFNLEDVVWFMEEIKVPKYVLESIENTLRRWANINNSYLKSSCLDRDTIGNLVAIEKLLNGKELTGMERLENYGN